jgi:hypothetical protein
MATRYDQRTPNLFPASAWSPPWSTGDGLIESGSRLTLAYPISTVSRKPRFHRVSIKPFLRRFYVYLRTEDPNLRRGAWRPSSTSRGDVLAYRGGDVGGLVAGSRCKMHWQLVNFKRGGEEFRRLARMSMHVATPVRTRATPVRIARASPGVAGWHRRAGADRSDLPRLSCERGHVRLFGDRGVGPGNSCEPEEPVSKMPDGMWNPAGKVHVESRLRSAGIDIASDVLWTLAPQTRIETLHPPPSTGEPNWVRCARRECVGDWCLGARELAAQHERHPRFNKRTRCLTVYDAHNVQALAHRLVMEKFGFW